MRCALNIEQKCLQQPLELFKVNVCLSQMSWKIVSQPRTCSSKASVSIAAVGPSGNTMYVAVS